MKTISHLMAAMMFLLGAGSALAWTPANDNFADRITLSGTASGNTDDATVETGEPKHDGYPPHYSIWYSWTAPATGDAAIQLHAYYYAPIVAVYTGTTLNSLTPVGATLWWNNSGGTMKLPVVEGTTYQIAVACYYGNSGPIELYANMGATISVSSSNSGGSVSGGGTYALNSTQTVQAAPYTGYLFTGWTESGTSVSSSPNYQFTVNGDRTLVANFAPVPPTTNDDFANRSVLKDNTTSRAVDTSDNTSEPGEPTHGQGVGGKSAWWTWRAPVSGVAQLYVESNFQSMVAIYTGTSLDSLNQQAHGTSLPITFYVSKGVSYQIAVDSSSNAGGLVDLLIYPPQGPQIQIPSGVEFGANQKISVPVQLVSTGDENALAFSVNFDPAKLKLKGVELDPSQTGMDIGVSEVQSAQGRVGVRLNLQPGVTFPAGTQNLVMIDFNPVKKDADLSLTFGDLPDSRQVTGTDSVAIDTTYSDGSLKIRKYGEISLSWEPDGGRVEGLGNFQVGSTRTLRAKPAPGYIFDRWEDDETSPIRKAKVPVDGLEVAAYFKPSPALWKGSWVGRLDSNIPSLITLTLDGYKNFSAALQINGQTFRFHGKLDDNGMYDGMLSSPAGCEVSLDLDPDSGGFTGKLTQEGTATTFALTYSMHDAKVDTSRVKGSYTFFLNADPNDDNAPITKGFGTLKVSKTGMVRMVGKLGDGTAFSQSGVVDQGGSFSAYIPLYSRAGYLTGDLNFESTEISDVDGVLNWFKPARSMDSLYPDGISTVVFVQGCVYTPGSTFSQDFLGGTISFTFVYSDTLNLAKGANQLGTTLNLLNNQSAWIRLNPSTGVLSGNLFNGYTDPVTGKPANSPVQGVILQRLGIGGGFFFNGTTNAEFDVE